MDHGSAVEKLEGVREIEASLLQDFLTLFLIPFKFHDRDLAYVITICNHICSHTAPGAGGDKQADNAGPTGSNHALKERRGRRALLRVRRCKMRVDPGRLRGPRRGRMS